MLGEMAGFRARNSRVDEEGLHRDSLWVVFAFNSPIALFPIPLPAFVMSPPGGGADSIGLLHWA